MPRWVEEGNTILVVVPCCAPVARQTVFSKGAVWMKRPLGRKWWAEESGDESEKEHLGVEENTTGKGRRKTWPGQRQRGRTWSKMCLEPGAKPSKPTDKHRRLGFSRVEGHRSAMSAFSLHIPQVQSQANEASWPRTRAHTNQGRARATRKWERPDPSLPTSPRTARSRMKSMCCVLGFPLGSSMGMHTCFVVSSLSLLSLCCCFLSFIHF